MRIETASSSSRARLSLGLGALVLAATSALTGCPGSLDDETRFQTAGSSVGASGASGGSAGGDCPDVPQEIFTKSCGTSGCHGNMSPAAKLDLVSPDVASRVVGKPAQGMDCVDKGTLADPAKPEDSVLYTKLLKTPSCGTRMPLGGSLPDDQIACVKEWIAGLGQ